jgi:small subunit ribosomal protein S4
MSKYLGPKCRICRRAGEKLFLKGERCYTAKCAMVKRNYPPGVHGAKGYPKQSSYGAQLREKQKAKNIYNLLEKQFRLTFSKAQKMKGDAGKNLLKLLELRLDNLIYRAGFASSRAAARQLVNHGHFTVNGRRVNIPSYQVKTGDIISIKKTSRRLSAFSQLEEVLKKKQFPSWIHVNPKELTVKVLHLPKDKDVVQNINTQMIVEFYSR